MKELLPQGMKLIPLDPSQRQRNVFDNSRYSYQFLSQLDLGETVIVPPGHTAVFIHGGAQWKNEQIDSNYFLRAGESPEALKILSANSSLLMAGHGDAMAPGKKGEKIELALAKRVEKPWGFELWLNGEENEYSLKMIRLNAGYRTSLQFHRKKRETNIIFSGRFELTVLKDPNQVPSEEGGQETLIHTLDGPIAIDIEPLTLHRIGALSDLLMYEASSPELDDVVRVSDDSNRGHGRISSEHR